jgi:hypothetical protein
MTTTNNIANPSSSVYPKTIVLRGEPRVGELPSANSQSIKPGMLVERTSAGTVRKHATAGGRAAKMFALEQGYAGAYIDDAYLDAEQVTVAHCKPGDQINAWVGANALALVIGDLVESAGDGTLRKSDAATAAQAVLTLGTGNAAVKFTAADPGPNGNDITVEILAATAATATVAVAGNAIQIKPNSTTPGTTDLASTVVTLVNADPAARALVVASNPGTGGSAIVSPVAATNLAGGADTNGVPIAQVIEAKDNSAVGSPARVKVEVL